MAVLDRIPLLGRPAPPVRGTELNDPCIGPSSQSCGCPSDARSTQLHGGELSCALHRGEVQVNWDVVEMKSTCSAAINECSCGVQVVLAPVPDSHLGSVSGLEPNRWKIGRPGCQYTRTVNPVTIPWESTNLSEMGRLSAGCLDGPSIDSYNALVFCSLVMVSYHNRVFDNQEYVFACCATCNLE